MTDVIDIDPSTTDVNDPLSPEGFTGPTIEVKVVHQVEHTHQKPTKFVMLEVWTQNRLYSIDGDMKCIEVMDLATQKADPNHSLLGARLLGGQHVDESRTFLSHPYPRPGTEAVFEQPRPSDGIILSHSSTVTRVVLRLRQLTILKGSEETSWGVIANGPQAPAGGGQ